MSNSSNKITGQLQYCAVCRQLIRPSQFQSEEALVQNGTAYHAGCLANALGAGGSGSASGMTMRRQSGANANLAAQEPEKAQVHAITAGLARPAAGGHGHALGGGSGGSSGHGMEAGRSSSTGKHAVASAHGEGGRTSRRSGAIARGHAGGSGGGGGRSKSGAGLAMGAGVALVAIGIGIFFLLTRGDSSAGAAGEHGPGGAGGPGSTGTAHRDGSGGGSAETSNGAAEPGGGRGTKNGSGATTSGDPAAQAGKSAGDSAGTPGTTGATGTTGAVDAPSDQGPSPYEIAKRYKAEHPNATATVDPSPAPAPTGTNGVAMSLPLTIAGDAVDQPQGTWQRGEAATENGKQYIAWYFAKEGTKTLDFYFGNLAVKTLPPTLHMHVEYRLLRCTSNNLTIKIWTPKGCTSQEFVQGPPVGSWATADVDLPGCAGNIGQIEIRVPGDSGPDVEVDVAAFTLTLGK
ncbi:MAG: hypothetical protein ACREJ2_11600 [Planctomycetota bacterium]